MGSALMRQVLKKRRSFSATLFDTEGKLVLKVSRPAYLISSTIRVEDASGVEVGEVFQRWHLFKRNYDLYVRKQQFAEIKGGFLAWDFEFIDEKGGILARVDRNFQGWGKLLFTDAGQYAMYFGLHEPLTLPASQPGRTLQSVTHGHPLVDGQEMNMRQLDTPTNRVGRPDQSQFQPQDTLAVQQAVSQLQPQVARTMSVTERAVALGAAISIDYDYFSQHSSHGGGMMPFFMPMPFPGGGGGEAGGATPEAPPGTPPPVEDGAEDQDDDNGDDDGESGGVLGDLWSALNDDDGDLF